MIADAAGVFAREACQRERFSVAQRPWPAPPVFAAAPLADRLETGEAKQSVAALRDEAFEILRCPRARLGLNGMLEVPERAFEKLLLQGVNGGIVDQAAGVRRVEEISAANDVEIDRVEKETVGRIIGAGALAILSEKRVQRVDRDDRRSVRGRERAELRESREIADALVAVAPQRIKLRREAEGAPVDSWRMAAARRDGEAAIGSLQRDDVSPQRQARQARAQALEDSAIHAAPGDGLQIARAKIDAAPLAVFEHKLQPRRRAPIADRKAQKYVFVVAKRRAHRQRAAILATRQQAQAFPRLRLAVGGQMQRREQRFDGLARNRVLRAVDVPPTGRHARRLRQRREEFGRRFPFKSTALGRGLFAQDDDRARGDRDAVRSKLGRRRREANAPIEIVARRRRRDGHGLHAPVPDNGDAISGARAFHRRIEAGEQRRRGTVAPIFLAHERAIGAAPFDVGNERLVERRAQQKAVARQRGRVFAQRDQAARERQQLPVRPAPIEPGGFVVLRIGVVVAGLRLAKLRAHRQHGRSAREQQARQQIALILAARREDDVVARFAFDSIVPGKILVRPVAVVFAIGVVAFMRIRHEIAQCEAVMRRDEIYAS